MTWFGPQPNEEKSGPLKSTTCERDVPVLTSVLLDLEERGAIEQRKPRIRSTCHGSVVGKGIFAIRLSNGLPSSLRHHTRLGRPSRLRGSLDSPQTYAFPHDWVGLPGSLEVALALF
jgi:hypothetical protein